MTYLIGLSEYKWNINTLPKFRSILNFFLPLFKVFLLVQNNLDFFINLYWNTVGLPVVLASTVHQSESATAAAAAAVSLQSCPTLCDPIDSSPPGLPSLGFSRQEHWSGLPFPSPMHESEKWKWSRSLMSDSYGLQPTRLLRPWDFLGKSTRVGCHCFLQNQPHMYINPIFLGFLPHLGHCGALSRVPCAIKPVLINYLFYTQ